MAFEAYSVAVKLSLINHVSSGLLLISKGLNSTGMDVDRLNEKLKSIGKQAAIGGAMFAGGLGIAGLLKVPLDEAKKFETETQRFRSLGLGDAVTNDAVKFATGMNSYGTSIRENLGLLRDAQTVFGDFHEAQLVTPLLAKMKFANAALYGDEGGAMKDKAFMDMLKVIEMRGGLASEAAFNNQANMVQRVQTATGGRVGANEFLNFIKTGGVAAKGMKDENFYYAMEPLIQEMGGQRVGTGLMSAYQNLVQGRTTQRAANELMRIGMLNPAMVDYDKVGNIKQIKPGGVRGTDLMVSDPMKWMQSVMLPAFASKGITDKQAILNEIGAIFTNRTASQLYSTMYLQQAQIEKNYKLNSGAAGIDELNKNAQNSLSGKQLAFGQKWNDLMLVLGNAILPIATRALDKLTPSLIAFSRFLERNHTGVKYFTYALIGLSAFLVGGGLINMVVAAGRGFMLLGSILGSGLFRGALGFIVPTMRVLGFVIMGVGRALLLNPIGLAITAIGTAAYLLWKNWDTVKPKLLATWAWMTETAGKLWDGVKSGFNTFVGWYLTAWQGLFNTLISGINAVLPASLKVQQMHFAEDYKARSAAPSGAVAPVPGPAAASSQQVVQINLDGKKLGEAVIDQMARAAARPQTSPQGFNLLRSPIMPGTSSTVVPGG